MKQPLVSICYYPTTVVLIDDNVKYIESMKLQLKLQNIPCKAFTSPPAALDFLTNEYQASPFTQRCLSTVDNYLVDRFATTFDERKIFQEIYNPKRMAEIGVLIVDYAMPGMNGIELCRRLREKEVPFKLLMLTGEASKDLAIEAFNEGIIDKFIMKKADNLMDVLVDSVHELQHRYFLDLSATLLNTIEADANEAFAFLSDPIFADFFHGLRKKFMAVEYYLLDEWGSFLLLDIDANPTWVLVSTDQGMEAAYVFAHDDEKAPRAVLDALKKKKKIAYFHNNTGPVDWEDYMHPVKELKGGLQTYYYAVVTGSDFYSLDQKKLFSCRSYLKTA